MNKSYSIMPLMFVSIFSFSCLTLSVLLVAHLEAGNPVAPLQDAPQVFPTEQREVVEAICDALTTRYVSPDVALKMAAHLREKLADGDYSRLTTPEHFAAQLQQDMREISHDRHLFVEYDPAEAANLKAASPGGADDSPPTGETLLSARRKNYGLRGVSILDGNVGYLDLRDFEHPNLSASKIAAAIELVSDCDALLIDLRSNGGGWGSTTAFLAAYFFPAGKEIHFTDFYDRPSDATHQSWTPAYVPGKTLPDIPLFVLISNRTFSAAEEFAYNLKNLNRATLVGERTRGGANNPGTLALNDHFVLSVPQGRPISPVTKSNWEGTGVAPDLAVPEKQALDAAHRAALDRLLSAAGSDPARFRIRWALDAVNARIDSVVPDRAKWPDLAGAYGRYRILFEQGILYFQREDRPKQAMLPLAQNYFAVDGLESQRLRFEADGLWIVHDDGREIHEPKTNR